MRFRPRAEQAWRRLEQLPEAGRVVPEVPALPYRAGIGWPFRFFSRNKEAAGGGGGSRLAWGTTAGRAPWLTESCRLGVGALRLQSIPTESRVFLTSLAEHMP